MPTNLLGIDTGDGGLVEKSVAIPTAVTKGVIGGIGQMLGVKKKDAPPPGNALPATGDAGAAAPAAQQAPPPMTGAPAPAAEAAPEATPPATSAAQQEPAPQAAPQPKKKGPAGAVNDLMQGIFGN